MRAMLAHRSGKWQVTSNKKRGEAADGEAEHFSFNQSHLSK
jgi:hypothetical protein